MTIQFGPARAVEAEPSRLRADTSRRSPVMGFWRSLSTQFSGPATRRGRRRPYCFAAAARGFAC